ncbi:MAG: hypothetical protein LBD67_09160 [Candidatus Accumulibacter sp.]|jgi:hypothetical protein|nr:hypothetical protein [Accumulibacter sp.]
MLLKSEDLREKACHKEYIMIKAVLFAASMFFNSHASTRSGHGRRNGGMKAVFDRGRADRADMLKRMRLQKIRGLNKGAFQLKIA